MQMEHTEHSKYFGDLTFSALRRNIKVAECRRQRLQGCKYVKLVITEIEKIGIFYDKYNMG